MPGAQGGAWFLPRHCDRYVRPDGVDLRWPLCTMSRGLVSLAAALIDSTENSAASLRTA